jgi:hypothetical protein
VRRDTPVISKSLLDAASMIWTLHIVLDTGTQIDEAGGRHSGTNTPHFPFIQKGEDV